MSQQDNNNEEKKYNCQCGEALVQSKNWMSVITKHIN